MQLQVTCERRLIADVACFAEQQAKLGGARKVSFHKSQEPPTAFRITRVFVQISQRAASKKLEAVAKSGHSKDMNETNAGEVAAAV
jgi:hypothetical protein